MGVKVRETTLKNDRVRLSLDIYKDGKSRFENLQLYLFGKPKTIVEKDHNKRTRQIAENIRLKREEEMQDDKFNIYTGFKSQGSFIDYFKKMTREKRGSGGNYGNWYSTCKHLVNFVNGKELTFEQCDDKFLNLFKNYLLTGNITKGHLTLSKASASSYLNKIKAALTQAHIDNIISDNPGRKVRGIKVEESRREYLLLEEIKLLTKEECKIPIMKNAFLFSCLTGLRWSDINKLTWGEITFSEAESKWKILFSQQKTKQLQWHPISEQAYSILGKRGENDERVFKGLKYSAWHNFILAEWVLLAGIKKHITFHSGRHTYATLLLTHGADIFTVSKLLGHKDIATTQIYGKIIDSRKNEVIELLPDIGI
ncbi:Site-specific recombinase XerD [Daejeonella rubra]|uniref:Site-specific recombinase XerD n=1 Tax=Daejeonella rubra TaxID=990371 RepID=A0A1G9M8H3_9SPHI|nr:site-specific integrase [Daejeonella rubra]SDL70251.1 Site-specific recombinase XerD [Daejeonella rubra]